MASRPLAVAWFTQQEYWKLLAVSEQGRYLPQTHADWTKSVNAEMDRLMSRGLSPIKVYIRVAEFVQFCNEAGRRLDGAALDDFAAIALRELYDRDGRGPGAHVGERADIGPEPLSSAGHREPRNAVAHPKLTARIS